MIKISAVIITKNEERNIARCLKSLQNIVDEVVVVDSLSTDRTKEICLEFGVRFIEQEWLGYGEQKNLGNREASYDYILSLDADELLSDELQKAILDIKQNCTHDAYSFNRLNIYCGKAIKHCGWYPDKRIRLWDRRKGEWDKAEVHEQLQLQEATSVAHLNKDIIHYSYLSISDHVARIPRYSDLWVEKAVRRNKKVSFFKLFITVPWRFFDTYILHLGFLDGFSGLTVSTLGAFSSFQNYVKLYYYRHTRKNIEVSKNSLPKAPKPSSPGLFTIRIKVSGSKKLSTCLFALQSNSRYNHKIVLEGNVSEDLIKMAKAQTSFEVLGIEQAADSAYCIFMNDSIFVCKSWDHLLLQEFSI